MSNFSFSHIVLETRKNQGLFEKGLRACVNEQVLCYFRFRTNILSVGRISDISRLPGHICPLVTLILLYFQQKLLLLLVKECNNYRYLLQTQTSSGKLSLYCTTRVLTTLEKKPFENIVRKEENAGNQHFFLFSTMFSVLANKKFTFFELIYLVIRKCFQFRPKFCCLAKG